MPFINKCYNLLISTINYSYVVSDQDTLHTGELASYNCINSNNCINYQPASYNSISFYSEQAVYCSVYRKY